ncbi:hypothetical protein ACTPEW_17595 [Clostridioides difficile]
MADIEVYRTIKKRKGVYSASDICLPPYSYDSISSTYYGRYRLNTSKIFTITETGAYKFGSYEVYIYVDGREVIQKDYHMYQNVTVQVVPNPTLSINSDLGVISEACSIKYNIYDNNPDIKFKITVKLNDVVISEKYNIVDSNYTIDLTDEYLSKLTLNSVNNVTVEIGTDDGGKILDKTVTFTKGNTKPKLNISSYNSTSATFTAIDTDNNLSKIEWYLDDVLKETITTDLTAEKTINYELTDNAIHTLKIVATDAENATAEKVLSISKEIMPLQTDATLQDISTKLAEIGEGFKNGKTSIINTLALKNNNTLVELSEKIKASFDSGDASLQDLTNKLTQANNTISQLNAQLVQRKRWATGTFDQSKITSRSTTIPMNLSFTPSIIFVSCGINFSFAYASARSCNLKFFTNLMKANPTTSTINDENFNGVVFATVEEINKSNFVLYLKGFSYNGSDANVSAIPGTTFNWTAIE